jgi:hypothetical protein
VGGQQAAVASLIDGMKLEQCADALVGGAFGLRGRKRILEAKKPIHRRIEGVNERVGWCKGHFKGDGAETVDGMQLEHCADTPVGGT